MAEARKRPTGHVVRMSSFPTKTGLLLAQSRESKTHKGTCEELAAFSLCAAAAPAATLSLCPPLAASCVGQAPGRVHLSCRVIEPTLAYNSQSCSFLTGSRAETLERGSV